ncbi:MAG: peroxiredoxin [Alphaproteobacteria bacterium]|jgi:peroxiredoxin|nr:peroxiredoxin [Alphaproteobacteria bacterium]
MTIGKKLPENIVFHVRHRDESIGGENPYKWKEITTADYFNNKRILLFSLPGAFTPTCSTYQLPGFEKHYDAIKKHGINEIYCISVNDSFVMNKWAQDQHIRNVKVIADGSALFTNYMNMLVLKDNLSFGQRSWRYAAIINNGVVEKLWEEPGKMDNCLDDPYGETSPEKILQDIKNNSINA